MAVTNVFVVSSSGGDWGWQLNAGGSVSACLAGQNDGQYVYNNAGGYSPSMFFSAGAIPSGAIISGVTITYYTGRSGSNTGNWRGSVSVDGSNWTNVSDDANPGANWTLKGPYTWSRSWVVGDLANARFRIQNTSGGGADYGRLDYAYLAITWQSPGLLVFF